MTHLNTTFLSEQEESFLTRCLQLAENGLYTTTPNPRVGCVIVRDNAIIAEGWHKQAGSPHAEINAIKNNDVSNSDIYVSLEPCASQGKTPPCVDAIIAARPKKVIVAMLDPNPATYGKSILKLQAANIETKIADNNSVVAQRAAALNIGFISRIKRHRPWVRCKIAMSLDGKTALKSGLSEWISNDASRKDAHHWRAQSCAVITGIGTALHDNPLLTVRHQSTTRQPLRILLDSQGRATREMALFNDSNILWVTANGNTDANANTPTPPYNGEHINLPNDKNRIDLNEMLAVLADKQINEVLLEAGRKLNGAMLQAGLIDECIIYCAPCLFGESARDMFLFPSPKHPNEAPRFKLKSMTAMGDDDIRMVYQCSDTTFI